VRLPVWVVAPVKLVAAAVRHPNSAQVMTIRDGRVEVERRLSPACGLPPRRPSSSGCGQAPNMPATYQSARNRHPPGRMTAGTKVLEAA